MLYALLFLPALLAIGWVLLRGRRSRPPAPRVLAEAVPAPPTISGEPGPADPIATLEALLSELERATLDERDLAELEALADELEAVTRRLERVG